MIPVEYDDGDGLQQFDPVTGFHPSTEIDARRGRVLHILGPLQAPVIRLDVPGTCGRPTRCASRRDPHAVFDGRKNFVIRIAERDRLDEGGPQRLVTPFEDGGH